MDRDQKRALVKSQNKLLDLLNPKDGIVDYLFAEEILASVEKDEIFLKSTTKEQARELLEILPRKGSKAWGAFLIGLKESGEASAHGEAATLLEETLAIVIAGRSPRVERKSNASAEGDGGFFSRFGNKGSASDTSPDWLGVGSSSGSTSGINFDDEKSVYKMCSEPRGLAYVINNKNFSRSSGMPRRNGTDVDMDALDKLWGDMGFETKVFKDQGGSEMRYELGRLAKMDHTGRDCVLISILTHGVEGKLYGSDGDLVPVEDLIELFNNDVTHKSLIGKPKLFFLQACRGDYFDKGTDLPDGDIGDELAADIAKEMLQTEMKSVDVIDGKLSSVPSASDMFIGYATVPGFVSWRNSERGSWFVQSIIKVFREYSKREHLLDMMVRVNSAVASEFEASGHNKQVPSPVVRLTKKLFFRPGYYA